MRGQTNTAAVFWAQVDKTETCWLWTRPLDRDGYGRFTMQYKTWRAHRLSYILTCGQIPDGLTLDHLCRVRHCVNPDHLEPVTNAENILRGESFAAQNAAKTHCKNGHEFSEANTLHRQGGRACRTCRDADNAYWNGKAAERRRLLATG